MFRPATSSVCAAVLGATLCTAVVQGQVAPVAESAAGPTFMSARFASAGALTLYGGYRVGALLGFVGLVQNPRTEYREAIVGIGRTFGFGARNSLLAGLAVADASDARYTQVYLLPLVVAGPLLLDGTLEGYLPLGARGAAQLSASPLNLLYRPGARHAIGLSYVNGIQRGQTPAHAVGPSLRLGIPHGTLALDVLHSVGLQRRDLRLTAQVAY